MRVFAKRGCLLLLCGLLFALALGVSAAQANRQLLTDEVLITTEDPQFLAPPPEGQIEGACGIAVSPLNGDLYVSDYYHHMVDVFSSGGTYKSQLSAGISPEGPCQLAFDSTGALYANLWHESVMRLKPTKLVFDEANSTGVAVDASGKVYVNDRTHIAVYESTGGAPIQEIGVGNLQDAYGLAVFAGRVYVADAATKTVKVFEPAVSLSTPQATIGPPGGFNSLLDATVAIDPTNGHLIVIDNLQPGYEHPKGAIVEFGSNGAFLGQLKATVIHGEPSGVAIDAAGNLYVTSGNSEGANAFGFGPYSESGPEGVEAAADVPTAPPALLDMGSAHTAVAISPPTASPAAARAANRAARRRTRMRERRKAKHRRAHRQVSRRVSN